MTILEHHNDETTPLQQCFGQHSNVLSRLYTTSCWPKAGDIRWLFKQFPMSAICPEGKNVIAKQNAFCAEFPLSVTCPDGRAAIQKQNAFCSQFPMSASCPKGKAAMEKKTRWCTDFPKSAVCSWAAHPITLRLSQYDWLRHTSPKSILTILIFLVSIRLK